MMRAITKRKRPLPCRRFPTVIFFSWLLIAAQLACVKLPRRNTSASAQNAPSAVHLKSPSESLININAATREELEKLPGIGQALAARIVEYRERYGRFRRVEHLLMVRGISERRYHALSALVTVE